MANETVLSGLIDPQVIAAFFEAKLTNALKFAPLFDIDTTLVGRAGDTISVPVYAYIGDAETVAELGAIPVAQLTASMQDVKVTKAGKGVVVSDEAVLSAYGDTMNEAASQLVLSIASKLDNDCLTALGYATKVSPCVSVTPNAINEALELFGEDIEGPKVLLIGPKAHTVLRQSKDWVPASEIAARITISGTVGEIYGCQVVVSNKITAVDEAYIVKPGAGKIYLKRETEVEPSRDAAHKATALYADKHYAAYLYNASKVIMLGTATMVTLTVSQTSNISGGKAKFKVAGYPTNVSGQWKAYYATNLNSAATPSVGDAYSTVSATFDKEYEGEVEYTATNSKYFQVIYVDADNKIRATGSVAASTSIG